MTETLIIDAFDDLLKGFCTPARVRQMEEDPGGITAKALWQAFEASGLAQVLVPEADGGAGLTFAQVYPLLAALGRQACPLPLAERMVEQAFGADAAKALTTRACLDAAHMAGAMQTVLDKTLQYANDRQQFGRPLGKFQAIQHQLAVMAEQTLASQMAAQIGCRHAKPLPNLLNVAVAKARCCEAAVEIAALGHSIHGAIGFTAEFDLQLFTRRLHTLRQASGSESYWHDVLGRHLVAERQDASLELVRELTD